MKNEGITQGPFYAVQNSVMGWEVKVGPGPFDQGIAYFGKDNPHVETGSAKGNAQLFAAAPELLAFAYAYCNTWPTASADDELATQARAAIAKAEGRA